MLRATTALNPSKLLHISRTLVDKYANIGEKIPTFHGFDSVDEVDLTRQFQGTTR
jgi:hypothetical protein